MSNVTETYWQCNQVGIVEKFVSTLKVYFSHLNLYERL